jgi:uncharacterized protein YacL
MAEPVNLATALVVPFAAGFVVQRLLDLVDPLTTAKIKDSNIKKLVMGLLSLLIGWLLAALGDIEIFRDIGHPLNALGSMGGFWDIVFSGIFISAGTEGFNTLLKFANYQKESSKAKAASMKSNVTDKQLAEVNPQPS